jgi:hypothetical protein
VDLEGVQPSSLLCKSSIFALDDKPDDPVPSVWRHVSRFKNMTPYTYNLKILDGWVTAVAIDVMNI